MSRSRLHVNNLDAFATYCEAHGWKREPTKGTYQVLRMRHPSCRDPLIVHRSSGTAAGNELVHLTTHGHSETMLSRYLRDKKRTDSGFMVTVIAHVRCSCGGSLELDGADPTGSKCIKCGAKYGTVALDVREHGGEHG